MRGSGGRQEGVRRGSGGGQMGDYHAARDAFHQVSVIYSGNGLFGSNRGWPIRKHGQEFLKCVI
eukprot:747753-Prorocentrum_minimum.AAC.1